jgi:maleylacetate reductase
LPHATHFNREAAPEAITAIERALGADDAAGGLYDLAAGLGAPASLASLGLREEYLDRVSEIATKAPYFNPRPVDRGGVRALLDDAFHGRRPG